MITVGEIKKRLEGCDDRAIVEFWGTLPIVVKPGSDFVTFDRLASVDQVGVDVVLRIDNV